MIIYDKHVTTLLGIADIMVKFAKKPKVTSHSCELNLEIIHPKSWIKLIIKCESCKSWIYVIIPFTHKFAMKSNDLKATNDRFAKGISTFYLIS